MWRKGERAPRETLLLALRLALDRADAASIAGPVGVGGDRDVGRGAGGVLAVATRQHEELVVGMVAAAVLARLRRARPAVVEPRRPVAAPVARAVHGHVVAGAA